MFVVSPSGQMALDGLACLMAFATSFEVKSTSLDGGGFRSFHKVARMLLSHLAWCFTNCLLNNAAAFFGCDLVEPSKGVMALSVFLALPENCCMIFHSLLDPLSDSSI